MGTLGMERSNFYKIVTLLVDKGGKLLIEILMEHCKTNTFSFVEFLEQNQHEIFHFWYNNTCCQCGRGGKRRTFLQEKQWRTMFMDKASTCCDTNKQCVQKYTPDQSVTPEKLDITLASSLVLNLVPSSSNGKDLIRDLKDHRNSLYAHARETKISTESFNIEWQKVKMTLCNIKRVYLRSDAKTLSEEIDLLYSSPYEIEVTHFIQVLCDWTKSDISIVMELRELKETLLAAGIGDLLPRIEALAEQIPIVADQEILELKRYIDDSLNSNSLDNNLILEKLKRLEEHVCHKLQNSFGNIHDEIDNHKSIPFVSTRAVSAAQEKMKNGVVIYRGEEGSGKSRNCLEVLNLIQQRKMLVDKWNIIRLPSVKQLDNVLKFSEKTVVFVDDILQDHSGKSEFIRKNGMNFEGIAAAVKNGRLVLVASMRTDVFQQCKTDLQRFHLFEEMNVIDLSSSMFRLTAEEKVKMLEEYCKFHNITIIEDDNEVEKSNESDNGLVVEISRKMLKDIAQIRPQLGFPLYCKSFFTKMNMNLGLKCFKQPTEKLSDDIKKLTYSSDKTERRQFCILVSILLSDKENNCNIHEIQEKLEVVELHILASRDRKGSREMFEVDKLAIKNDLDQMTGKFIQQIDDVYKFQHDAVMVAVFIWFGRLLKELYPANVERLIQSCEINLLYDFVRTQSCHIQENEMVFVLNEASKKRLVERFFDDLRLGDVYHVLSHEIMNDKVFVDLFVSELVKPPYVDIFEVPYVNGSLEQRTLFELACLYSPPGLVKALLMIDEYYDKEQSTRIMPPRLYRRVASRQPLCHQEMIENGYHMACCRGNGSVVLAILSGMDDTNTNIIAKGLNESCTRGKINTVIEILRTRMDLKSDDIAEALAQATKRQHLNIIAIILKRMMLPTEVFLKYMNLTVFVFLENGDDSLTPDVQRSLRKKHMDVIASILLIKKEITTEFLQRLLLTAISKYDCHDIVEVVLRQRPDFSTEQVDDILLQLTKTNTFLRSLRSILRIRINISDISLLHLLIEAAKYIDGTNFIHEIVNVSRDIGPQNTLEVLEKTVTNASNDSRFKANIDVLVKTQPKLTKENIQQLLLHTLHTKKYHLADAIFNARKDLNGEDVTNLLLKVLNEFKHHTHQAVEVILRNYNELSITQIRQVLHTTLCLDRAHKIVDIVLSCMSNIPSSDIVLFTKTALTHRNAIGVLKSIFLRYKKHLKTDDLLTILRHLIKEKDEMTDCLDFILKETEHELCAQQIQMLFLELINENPTHTNLAKSFMRIRNDLSLEDITEVLRKACKKTVAPKIAEIILLRQKRIQKETVNEILETMDGKTECKMIEIFLKCRKDLQSYDLKKIIITSLPQADSPAKIAAILEHGHQLSQLELTDVMIASLDHATREKIIGFLLEKEKKWHFEFVKKLCIEIIRKEDSLESILDIVLAASKDNPLTESITNNLLHEASKCAHVKGYLKVILRRRENINEDQMKSFLIKSISSINAKSIFKVTLSVKPNIQETTLQECMCQAIKTRDGNVVIETIIKHARNICVATLLNILDFAADIEGGITQAKSIFETRKDLSKENIKSLMTTVIYKADGQESVCCILDSRSDLKSKDLFNILRILLNLPNGHRIMKEIFERKCPDVEKMFILLENAIHGCHSEQLKVLMEYSNAIPKDDIIKCLDMTISDPDISEKAIKIKSILDARRDIGPDDTQAFLKRVLEVNGEPDIIKVALKGRDDMAQWRYKHIFKEAACAYKRQQCVKMLLNDTELRSNLPADHIDESFLEVVRNENSLTMLGIFLDNDGWSGNRVLTEALDQCLEIQNGSQQVSEILQRNFVPMEDIEKLLQESLKREKLGVLQIILELQNLPKNAIMTSLKSTLDLSSKDSKNKNYAMAAKIILKERNLALSQEEIDLILQDATNRRQFEYIYTVIPVLSFVSVNRIIDYMVRHRYLKTAWDVMNIRREIYHFPTASVTGTFLQQRLVFFVGIILLLFAALFGIYN